MTLFYLYLVGVAVMFVVILGRLATNVHKQKRRWERELSTAETLYGVAICAAMWPFFLFLVASILAAGEKPRGRGR